MSELTLQHLACRIRELRTERGMTLQEVADATGLSKGQLSKIETGGVSPPIATLAKLAEALEVSIGEFFARSGGDDTVVFFPKSVRQNVRGRLSHRAYRYELLVPGRKRRDMQPMIVTVDSRTYKFKLMDHAGEQFIYLLEGEMDYVVGDRTYQVKEGDSLYFEASNLHGPKLKRNQRARYLVVFSSR
jgi:transcriptional regulator with XRE-family HTH domain